VSELSALLVKLETPEGDLVDVGFMYNADEKNWFEFSEHYWDLPNRPVLGQTFEEHGRSWRPSAHVALPKWFSHLLPEGRLRDAVASAAGTNRAREFNLLARIGIDDLPGALRIGTADELRSVKRPPELAAAEDDAGGANPLLKFSLAGAQLKFSVYRGTKGLTVPAKGQAGNVIAKLPDNRPGFFGVPETELACLNLARLSGIDTPKTSLVSISEITGLEDWAREVSVPALTVDRFDRKEHGRVHMEELAQILNIPAAVETAKYRRANFETIASIVGALCGPASVGDVITRIVFNVLIGNGDAHLKNWAVLYPDGITPVLSPIYDVLPTVLFIPSDDMGLKLADSKAFEDVSVESFDGIGRRTAFGVDNARACAREAVERILENWDSLGEILPSSSFKNLANRLNTLALIERVSLLVPAGWG
jgi:serine/threonine-protein kinase HipA